MFWVWFFRTLLLCVGDEAACARGLVSAISVTKGKSQLAAAAAAAAEER
jgi:hypothetical protein